MSWLSAAITSRKLINFRRLLVLSAIVAFLLVSVSLIGQEQIITRIGIVDLDEIVRAHFRESNALRSYEERRKEAVVERDAIEERIRNLDQALLFARQTSDRSLVLQLETELFDLRKFLLEFVRIKDEQLLHELNGLKTSDAFVIELTLAIQYVAEAGGYALIMRHTQDFLFWRPEIDVTDKVIAELARRAARS